MKKLFNLFALMAFMFTASFVFTACSDDDDNLDKEQCYFTLGIDDFHFSGSSEASSEVMAYQHEVYTAYLRALGMTSDDNTLFVDGDYSKTASQMRDKFNGVVLPDALKTDGGYTFSIVLRGCKYNMLSSMLEKMDVIASKTFSNEN